MLCCCRYGSTCARYVKADLPLLDAASSRAASAFTTVLVIGIVLIIIAAALLVIAVIIIIHQRRRLAEFRTLTAFPCAHLPLHHSLYKVLLCRSCCLMGQHVNLLAQIRHALDWQNWESFFWNNDSMQPSSSPKSACHAMSSSCRPGGHP